ncbi:MAG: AEC family transporter [Rubrobacteraceae bacterium]
MERLLPNHRLYSVRTLQVILNTALPFFALIFCGYGAGRFRLLSPAAVTGINSFVFYFALPVFIFNLMATAPLVEVFSVRFMGIYLGVGLAVYAASAIVGRIVFGTTLGESAIQGASAALGNTGYMGLPLVAAAFGREATIPLLLGLTIEAAILIPLTVVIIESDKGFGGQWRKLISSVSGSLVRNPLIVAIFAGVLVSGLGPDLPTPIANFTDLLGNAAGPCALFALGATLAAFPVSAGLPETSYMSAFKLLVHPAAMWLAMTQLFDVNPLWASVAILGASLPVAANVFILARQYDTYIERASSTILLSTAISVLTVSTLLTVLPLE